MQVYFLYNTCVVFQCCGRIFKNSLVCQKLNFRVKVHQSAAPYISMVYDAHVNVSAAYMSDN